MLSPSIDSGYATQSTRDSSSTYNGSCHGPRNSCLVTDTAYTPEQGQRLGSQQESLTANAGHENSRATSHVARPVADAPDTTSFAAPHAYPSRCFHACLKQFINDKDLAGCPYCYASPLHHLASIAPGTSLRKFHELIERYRAFIPSCDIYGNTCLHFAISSGASLPQIKAFLQAGADLHAVNGQGQTVLHVLDPHLYAETLPLILCEVMSLGLDLKKRDYDGKTALHAICQKKINATELIDLLPFFRSVGPAINLLDNVGQSPLGYLKSSWMKSRSTREMIDLEVALKLKIPDLQFGRQGLSSALSPSYGMTSSLESQPAVFHPTPLQGGNHGALLSDRYSRNPLHYLGLYLRHKQTLDSCMRPPEFWQSLECLLQRGADVNEFDVCGSAPIHYFLLGVADLCHDHYVVIPLAIRMLLNYGANPNMRDREGNNALHLACRRGRTFTVQIILEHMAASHDGPTYVYLLHARNEAGRDAVAEADSCMTSGEDPLNGYRGQCIGLVMKALHAEEATSAPLQTIAEHAEYPLPNLGAFAAPPSAAVAEVRAKPPTPWPDRISSLTASGLERSFLHLD